MDAGTLLTEQDVLRDIRRFEAELAQLAETHDPHALSMRAVYRNLLVHRRKLLAAWRDGHPDQWFRYSPDDS